MVYAIVIIYFLPGITAFAAGIPRKWDLLVLNAALGLTGAGWLLCWGILWEEWDWWNGR